MLTPQPPQGFCEIIASLWYKVAVGFSNAHATWYFRCMFLLLRSFASGCVRIHAQRLKIEKRTVLKELFKGSEASSDKPCQVGSGTSGEPVGPWGLGLCVSK